MRLDKFLCETGKCTRSQARDWIRQGMVTVDEQTVRSPETRIREDEDLVCLQGRSLAYRKYVYYMLNKPRGVVSATADNRDKTVVELLGENMRPDIFPAGRLDKDTEGFLLLTNDGPLAHRLLAPGRHVDKTYMVTMEHALTREESGLLETGVEIGEKRPARAAGIQTIDETHILLTLQEGKFHQVKRMLQAVNNRVLALKRVSFGGIILDERLKPGEYRELTEAEVKILYDA